MNTTHWRRTPLAACCAALAALTLTATGATAASAAQQAAASEARRRWVVFMILTPSVSPVAGRTGRPPAGRAADTTARPGEM